MKKFVNKKKMIEYIRLILIGAFCTIIYADPPDWQVTGGNYQFTATIAGGIVLNGGERKAEFNAYLTEAVGETVFGNIFNGGISDES